jgi:glutamate-1-semialdehyde 2,1-aminomutase
MNHAMAGTALTQEYAARFPQSCRLHARAVASLAGEAAHDSWRFDPFPLYFARCDGARKTDVDGNTHIDFWMGHGALLLGHHHPDVDGAVETQLRTACHYGGAHALQVEWAERIVALVPSAERVRFVASGTEATLLALRVARSFTKRAAVIRIDGHFHGWHDEALAKAIPHDVAGFNPGNVENLYVLPFDLDLLSDAVDDLRPAAIILEPGGGSAGALAWSIDSLAELRRITQRSGTLLIFDEIISGFRYAPGGVQELSGVMPDLTVLAKIAAGGLPGAALAGRADIMRVFGAGIRDGAILSAVPHTGTFNASATSAAAAIATLYKVADGTPQAEADRAAGRLVDGINRRAAAHGAAVRAFRQSSIFHLVVGVASDEHAVVGPSPEVLISQRTHRKDYAALRQSLLLNGFDAHLVHGWVSAVHSEPIIDAAIEAFDRALARLGRGADAPNIFRS